MFVLRRRAPRRLRRGQTFLPLLDRSATQGLGVAVTQVALAWLLSKPFLTAPIIGASKPEHLEDAVAAVSLELSDEEIKKLEEPYVPHPVVGF